MKIEGLFLSPAHIYFGHHGGPAGAAPIVAVSALECIADRGVTGDRFFDHAPDYKGQITFFGAEIFDALCAAVGASAVPPSAVRRNVITRGVDLNGLIGREFELQGVRFLGTEECRPCYWMAEAVAPGAEQWLQGRGGLRAKIVSSGWLNLDPPTK